MHVRTPEKGRSEVVSGGFWTFALLRTKKCAASILSIEYEQGRTMLFGKPSIMRYGFHFWFLKTCTLILTNCVNICDFSVFSFLDAIIVLVFFGSIGQFYCLISQAKKRQVNISCLMVYLDYAIRQRKV